MSNPSPSLMNVPNRVTMARIFLSMGLFLFLAIGWYTTSFVLFMLGAATDWIDGFWARRYGQVTQFGRVIDPFADKLLICGTFIFLAAVPPFPNGVAPSGIAAWMTVIIVARELLVTALRTFIEQQKRDFSAKWVGKWKMVFQCVAAGWSMVHLSYVDSSGLAWKSPPPDWISRGLPYVVWGAVLLTIYSGFSYVRAAVAALRDEH